MKLRKLEEKDADLMFEWMHDESVIQYMQTNFSNKTRQDCINFIAISINTKSNLHLAIVNDDDEYMGTVSLKNINGNSAEFAITIRKSAMGLGFSKYAMNEIIKIGFEELNLNNIYWCVNPRNKRAIRFYDKNHYKRIILGSDKNFGGGTLQNRFKSIFGIKYQKYQEGLSTTKYIQQCLLADV